MKKAFKRILFNTRFNLSASNNFLFMRYYQRYTPKVGSMEELLSSYSKDIGSSFTVIQIGANDGITHDPIHKFIKRDKWNGILLEPQKYVFDRFLSRIYRKHNNVTVLNAALGNDNGEASIYKIGFSNERWATGLTTFDRSTLEKAFESGHVKRKCEKDGTVIPEDMSTHIVEERVTIISPVSLMEQYNVQRIDLLMIDTEGFDFEVIKMFDIAASRPGLIIFEHSHLSEADYQSCLSLLTLSGYESKKDGANTVAIRSELNRYSQYFTN